jgi:hypothetical protein
VQPHAPVAGAAVRIGTSRGPAGRSAEKGDPSSRRPPLPAGSSPFPGGQPPVRRCASRVVSPSGRTLRRCSSGAMPSCESCVEWPRRRRPPVRAGLRGSDPGPATGGPRADGPPAVPDPSGRWRAAPDPAPGVAVREVLDRDCRCGVGCSPRASRRRSRRRRPRCSAARPDSGWHRRRRAGRHRAVAHRPQPGLRGGGGHLPDHRGRDLGAAATWAATLAQPEPADGLPADGSLDDVVPVLTNTSDIHPNGATSGGHVRAVPIVSGPTGGQPREELP